MSEIPLAPVERILKNAGAKRVSRGAVEEFAKVIEDLARDLATEATILAKHAGRRTITDADIRLAKKRI